MDNKVELTAAERLAKFEAEKMSRRKMLGRFGFTAAAVAVASLTSDDLLRKVGVEMQKRAGDNKIANQVAKELQNAGVANAAARPPCNYCQYAGAPHVDTCGEHYCMLRRACRDRFLCRGIFDFGGFWGCLDEAKAYYQSNCVGGQGCLANPVDCDCQQNETVYACGEGQVLN
jgi:hypothetical protein